MTIVTRLFTMIFLVSILAWAQPVRAQEVILVDLAAVKALPPVSVTTSKDTNLVRDLIIDV